ncbi:hypothetical protein AVU43_gp09 [Ralstonia phage RSJ5]|uniref:Uncharacterized protein n=1 Tax=Ralstonia phage RSJ5 TaxID=1538364 RepID=A0A077KVN0_9CAUD|nr:hypothetical protein AVU43_gp09 [Ralstonia phage RSJ5]BAP34903.1 hypothetical protein [Ralstonia phage RSJ5]
MAITTSCVPSTPTTRQRWKSAPPTRTRRSTRAAAGTSTMPAPTRTSSLRTPRPTPPSPPSLHASTRSARNERAHHRPYVRCWCMGRWFRLPLRTQVEQAGRRARQA